MSRRRGASPAGCSPRSRRRSASVSKRCGTAWRRAASPTAQARSRTRAMTLAQSPGAGCRNNRMRRIPRAASRDRASSASPAGTAAAPRPAGRARRRHGRPRCPRRSRDRRAPAPPRCRRSRQARRRDATMRGSRASISASAGRSSRWMLTKRTSVRRKQRLELRQRQRAVAVVDMGGAAGPGQRDARRRQRLQARPPFRDRRLRTRADRECPPERWTVRSCRRAAGSSADNARRTAAAARRARRSAATPSSPASRLLSSGCTSSTTRAPARASSGA